MIEPKFVVIDSEFWPKIKNVLDKNGLLPDIFIPIGSDEVLDTMDFKEFINTQSEEPPEIEIHVDDIWEILFTSGTTSMPKCVMISHMYTYMCSYNFSLISTRGHLIESDLRTCSFLPIVFHSGEHIFAYSNFLAGGSFVIGRKFDLKEIAKAVTQEKVTALWAGSPAFLCPLIDLFWKDYRKEKYDASSLKVVMHSWSALDPEYWQKLKAICGQEILVVETYGLTESLGMHCFRTDKWREAYLKYAPATNCVAVPNPILAAVLMDPNGNIINEAGKPGEDVYRSPVTMAGYYKDEKATKEAFKYGWMHSGDCCMYDENNLKIMVDRYKDVIKSGGENVSSIRVESVLLQHPKVKRAAIIGTAHEKWGEMVTAVVVLEENEFLEEGELIGFCKTKLASYETPKKIYFKDKLPETYAGGKVLKYKLREELKKIKYNMEDRK
jgi:acyl-CoA synthetase (AMP-forming)/AMP-acid ligase II